MGLPDDTHQFVGMSPNVPEIIVTVRDPRPIKSLLQVLVYHPLSRWTSATDTRCVEQLAKCLAGISVVGDPAIGFGLLVEEVERFGSHKARPCFG
jgi:hypothetical protein